MQTMSIKNFNIASWKGSKILYLHFSFISIYCLLSARNCAWALDIKMNRK